MTNVNDVLASLEQQHNGAHLTKVAAAPAPADQVAAKRAEVDAVLAKIAGAVSPEAKTAADTSNGTNGSDASEGLRKMAAEIEYAENMATLKQANLFGAGVFDSFIRRGNQYAEAVLQAQTQAKTAQAQPQPQATEPATEETAQLLKEAAVHGAAVTEQVVLKVAAAAGARETHETLVKIANQNTPPPAEKSASDDGIAELANMCEHCFNAGFTQMNELLNVR